jgi:hypothetical protein
VDTIRQRSPHDCGICAIAMATGRSYEDVLAVAGDNYRPDSGIHNEWELLERLGLVQGGHDGTPEGDFVHVDSGAIRPAWFRILAWGRRAIMAVPSLNTEGSFHLIYFDGGRVFDPHPNKRYIHFAQLEPVELILFREAVA